MCESTIKRVVPLKCSVEIKGLVGGDKEEIGSKIFGAI